MNAGMRTGVRALLLATVILAGPPVYFAHGEDPLTCVWVGPSGGSNDDGNWSAGGNWDEGVAPGDGDTAILPDVNGNGSSGSPTRTVTVDIAVTVADIKMPQNTDGFTNNILLAADLTTGSFSEFHNRLGKSRITIPAGYTLRVGDGDASTKLPSVYGDGIVRKVGTGQMTTGLAYNGHVFHGEWIIEDGVFYTEQFPDCDKLTVMAGATAKFKGLWHSGAMQWDINGAGFDNEGAVSVIQDSEYIGQLTLVTDSTINVLDGKTMTLSGTLTGSGALTKIGLGRLIITGEGAKDNSGETIVSEGELEVKSVLTASHVTVRAGARLIAVPTMVPQGVTVEEGGEWDQSLPPGWWGNGDPNNDGDWSVAANWGDGVPGPGDTAVLHDVNGNGNSGTSTRTVTVDVDVTVADIKMPQNTEGFTNNILLAADLTTGSFSEFNNRLGKSRITIPAGYTLRVGDGDVSTRLPSVYGDGIVRKVGTGQMTTGLAYNGHVFHGEWIIEDGVFYTEQFPDCDKLTVMAGATAKFNGLWPWPGPWHINGNGFADQGALNIVGDATYSGVLTFESDSTINVLEAKTMRVDGIAAGPGGLTKIGLGTLIIGVGSDHNGETIVQEGKLQVLGALANSHVTVKSGAVLEGAPVFFPQGVTVEDGGTWDRGPNFWWGNGDSNNDGNWSDGTMWVWGEAPPPDGVATFPNVTGNGNSGNSTRTVTVDVPVSIAEVQMPQTTGGYTNRILLAADLIIGRVTQYKDWVGPSRIEVPAGTTLTFGMGDVDGETPSLYGDGIVRKIGTGRLEHRIVGGTPGFSGQFIVEAGVFYMSRGFHLPCTVEVRPGATLHLRPEYGYNAPTTIAGQGYEGQGAILLTNYSLTLEKPMTIAADATINVEAGRSFTQAGAIDGPGGLTKTGVGTLSLSQGTIGGDVVVSEGVLRLAASDIIADTQAVYLEGSGSLDIADGTSDAVVALYFNGEKQADGTWGRTGSGAMHTNDTFFTAGSGILIVGPAEALVTRFDVTDQSTGSKLFTNSDTVDVALEAEVPEGAAIAGFVINQSGEEPAEWPPDATVPTTYTFDPGTPEGQVTLYAWVKDTNGSVGGRTATITYGTEEPVASDIAIRDGGGGTAIVTWITDIPAQGAVRFKAVDAPEATTVYETALGLSHHLTLTGLLPDTIYQVTPISNEVEHASMFYPNTWPISGDANMDCKVNILDLIFVRNRLNQDIGTGDNWQADVNIDGKINILDLIFVRNRLNTKCEE